jgi:hypothetical protein
LLWMKSAGKIGPEDRMGAECGRKEVAMQA